MPAGVAKLDSMQYCRIWLSKQIILPCGISCCTYQKGPLQIDIISANVQDTLHLQDMLKQLLPGCNQSDACLPISISACTETSILCPKQAEIMSI